MRWFSFFAALILGVHIMAGLSIAQSPTVYVMNKRGCVDGSPDAPAPTSTCPQVTEAEATACPTGPCYGYQNDGCQYYQQPTKSSQKVFQNDGESKTPLDITSGEGKLAKEKSRIICYQEKQCICEETAQSVYECVTRPAVNHVLIKWEITKIGCEVTIGF